MSEKMGAPEVLERVDSIQDLKNIDVSEVKVVKGSEAFHGAKVAEKPNPLHPRSLLLFLCVLSGFLCQTMNGYDGSLFNGLCANSRFLEFFDGSDSGPWPAKISAMYQVGGIIALPFVGPAIDTWGRKPGMFIGSLLVIVGTVLNGITLHTARTPLLMGGRFILGFGVSIASAAGPIYVVEASHPAFRGIATAYCNCTWFVGSILAAGAVRGALDLTGNASWQLPIWLQMVFPGIVCITAFLLPESPRWLYVNGKKEQAKQMLTTWHGLGNSESSWVKLQLQEYEDFLNLEGSDKRWWDYRTLFNTRASRYRIACNIIFSICAQWAGNGVLSYFLPAVLKTAGYTEDYQRANINLGYACFQFCFALGGAAFVDKLGRRPMMIGAMSACCIVWVGMTISSAIYNEGGQVNDNAARAVVSMIFIFGAFYSFGITPLQALYPVEVLSFEMRAKGMAFSSLAVNVGGLLNQFAWPISLANIGWKTYIVFTLQDCAQAALWYYIMPETKQRTLEELDEIFAAPKPVKHSLKAHKLAVNSNRQVVAVEAI